MSQLTLDEIKQYLTLQVIDDVQSTTEALNSTNAPDYTLLNDDLTRFVRLFDKEMTELNFKPLAYCCAIADIYLKQNELPFKLDVICNTIFLSKK